ncbi:MAG: TRAP transporter substrate-binding protein DctP [Trueperaceae bacterium]|nr:TRAP transporter substrate-binding protein DctP [Trueperaceae bacterium]
MKRRDFLKKSAVAASAALSANVFAQGNGTIEIEMASSFPTVAEIIVGTAERFAAQVNAMTDGDVVIRVSPAGAQIGAFEVYDAVSSGAFEMGHSPSYYYIGKNPANAFFTAIPFGMNAQLHNAWMMFGGGLELWNEISAADGLVVFPAGNSGMQTGGWFREEVNTIADLQGLRMRIPGLGGEVMARAGVNVQVIPGNEVFIALERGVIDAVEWVGPFDDEKMGFSRIAPYYYQPGWHEAGAGLGMYVNQAFFEGLPGDVQSIIETAARRANSDMQAEYDAANGAAFVRLIAGGAQPRIFSDEILGRLEAIMDDIHQENVDASPDYARVFENWSAFKANAESYHRVGDYNFLQFIYRDEDAS